MRELGLWAEKLVVRPRTIQRLFLPKDKRYLLHTSRHHVPVMEGIVMDIKGMRRVIDVWKVSF